MKKLLFALFPLFIFSCTSKKSTSDKHFPPISLINKIEFFDSARNRDKLGCGFLLKYRQDTFAVTAKHILSVAKTDSMKYLTIDKYISKWSMRPLNKEDESVVVDKLLNENKKEKINAKDRFTNDWMVFSIRKNKSHVQPVEFRTTPLVKGEKLYIVGWTRHETEGPQRVYEFKYYKTRGTHFLVKNLIVPEKFGGLSGAPVLDANGLLVGIVSNGTFEITALKKLFSPCGIENLRKFLDGYFENKQ